MIKENFCNSITCQGNCLECEFPDFVIKTLNMSNESKYIVSNLKERKYTMNACGDNRFEVIEKAKKHLLESTNIDSSKEMDVLDSFLYRCWQMGWLDKYDDTKKYISEKECRDCDVWKKLKYIESQDLIRREDAVSRIIKYIEDEGFCGLEKPMYVIDMIPRYNWTSEKDCIDK